MKTEATIDDDSARSCWGVTDVFGNWGWGLMGAELGGGRETAMLTGGAAGARMVDGFHFTIAICHIPLFGLSCDVQGISSRY